MTSLPKPRPYVRSHRAFTMMELILVIVVLGILTIMAAPVFRGIQERSRDTSSAQELAATARATSGYAALTARSTFIDDDVVDTVAEIPGYTTVTGEGAVSTARGQIAYSIEGGHVSTAMATGTGRCAFATVTRPGAGVIFWVGDEPCTPAAVTG